MEKFTIIVGYGFNENGAPLNLTAPQACETVERVMLVCSRLGGWTLSECWGGWVHNGETFREPSIRVEFASDCGREYAERVALCLRDTFEQNSVYFEASEPSISFI